MVRLDAWKWSKVADAVARSTIDIADRSLVDTDAAKITRSKNACSAWIEKEVAAPAAQLHRWDKCHLPKSQPRRTSTLPLVLRMAARIANFQ